jgi:exopolysaccharide biosynthesis protein
MLNGKANKAFYVECDLKDSNLRFDTDTAYGRLLPPSYFYAKNNKPYIVINGTFFSFQTKQNLNTVIKNGKPISYNIATVKGTGKDSIYQVNIYRSAIGISADGTADVAWINSDSTKKISASQIAIKPVILKKVIPKKRKLQRYKRKTFDTWPMQTAIGGGPVLLQNGAVCITNEEEMLFTGKNALNDKHPRTAMGYTADGKLIMLVVEGRNKGVADGATLLQVAEILKSLGCVEALNLDGGGSSCLLINGKETIKPSDKMGQRAIPAVFMVKPK